jgi:hypothetical protein
MKIQRFKNQVFNKPVGVVRSQERTAETDTWQAISKISSALSGEFFKKAVEEAKDAGIKRSLSVDVFDENMQITKAPISMGTVGTKAFEQNMLKRYENKMRSLLDNKIGDALRTNPNDADQYNNDASIAVAGLIDKADPSMKGLLTDYATAKIAIGANTVMANTKRIEDEQLVLDTGQQTESMANQAINAFANGDDRTGNQLMQTIEFEYNELVTEGVLTGGRANNRIVELRRRVLEQRIGISLQNFSSKEIGSVYDAFLSGRLDSLPDVVSDNSALDFKKRGVTYNTIKELLNNHPHTLDNLQIGRSINAIKTSRKNLEIANQGQIDAQQFYSRLDSGQKQDIGKKQMPIYEQFIYAQSGVEFSNNPSPDDILKLANSPKFYQILTQQMKIPDSVHFKLEQLGAGTLSSEYLFPVLEMYQQMKNNISNRGIPRDLTGGMGLKEGLNTKLQAINELVTFNGTQKGLEIAVGLAQMPQNDRVTRAIDSINSTFKPKSQIKTFEGARSFMIEKLNSKFDDMAITNEVVDETLILANMVGASSALQIMVDTVNDKFIQSKYTVDYLSGGTPVKTRFAPEVIFGQGDLLDKFESQLKEISGMPDAVLGEDLFVIVDPNSANSNVVYYVARNVDGDIQPIIENNQMISIKLSEYSDDMKAEEIAQLQENMDYAKMIKERLDEEFDINTSTRYMFGMWGGV